MRLLLAFAAGFAAQIAAAATPIDGLYATVFGGYAYLPDNVNATIGGLTRTDVNYQSGFDAGGSIGYKSNPMRYEGELTYFSADVDHFRINGVRQTGISGYANGILAMANVYYDFPAFIRAIQPYVGGGIGYGWINVKLNGSGPSFTSSFDASSNSAFAYQGMAGLTYNFAENYALSLGYRYVATDRIDDLGKVFQAHMANVGATYRFDECRYK